MRRFIDLPTPTKLTRIFALLAALQLILIAVASWLLLSLAGRQEKLFREDLNTVMTLEQIDSEFHRLRSVVLEMAFTGRGIDQGIAEIEKTVSGILEKLNQVETAIGDNPQLRNTYLQYRQLYAAFRETRQNEIFPALRQGRMQDALAVTMGVQDQRYQQIGDQATRLIDTAIGQARAAVEKASNNTYRAVAIFSAAGLLAVILCIYFASTLSRMITAPLHRLTAHAREIAAGNLSLPITQENREDEFGTLGEAFALMVQNLRDADPGNPGRNQRPRLLRQPDPRRHHGNGHRGGADRDGSERNDRHRRGSQADGEPGDRKVAACGRNLPAGGGCCPGRAERRGRRRWTACGRLWSRWRRSPTASSG